MTSDTIKTYGIDPIIGDERELIFHAKGGNVHHLIRNDDYKWDCEALPRPTRHLKDALQTLNRIGRAKS